MLTGVNIGYSEGIYTFPYFYAFLFKEYLKRKTGELMISTLEVEMGEGYEKSQCIL